MRRNVLRRRAVLTAVLLIGAAALLWPGASLAAPTLGADCGSGASIVGSDSAGKVTLGTRTGPIGYGRCTLTFSVPSTSAPACQGMNESGRYPAPIGVKSTT